MKRIFCALAAIALVSISANALATKKIKHYFKTEKELKMGEPIAFQSDYTSKEFIKLIKKAKISPVRKIADTDTPKSTELFSKQYLNIRDSLIGGQYYKADGTVVRMPGAKTPADLNNLLNQLDGQFSSGKITEPDARLLAAQLLLLKPMRGFIYRARHIFDANGQHAKFSHALAVTLLRTVAAGVDIYLPTNQWRAGFNYSIEPYYYGDYGYHQAGCMADDTWHDTCNIDDGPHLQAWLRVEVLPRLMALRAVLNSMNLSDHFIWADNKILYGTADFANWHDRFLRLGEAERLAMLSATEATISGIDGISAYSLSGYFDAWDRLAKVYGFQAVFNPGSSTAQERYNAIRAYPALFALKKSDPRTPGYLSNAYKSLKSSLQNAHLSWLYLQKIQNDQDAQNDNMIDPRIAAPFLRVVNTSFDNAFQIVGIDQNGNELAQGDVASALFNGEKVTVRLKEFYTNPPSSLQDFMPTGFEGGPDQLYKKVDGHSVAYRNYYQGRPSMWNYNVYNRYFPGVTSADGVKRTARVLAQSWGGFILGIPLSLVMM